MVAAYGDAIMAHPVGTGPFRLGRWTRASHIVLERSPTSRDETWDFEVPADAPEFGPMRLIEVVKRPEPVAAPAALRENVG